MKVNKHKSYSGVQKYSHRRYKKQSMDIKSPLITKQINLEQRRISHSNFNRMSQQKSKKRLLSDSMNKDFNFMILSSKSN